MRFQVEQRFRAPLAAVLAAYTDPAYYAMVEGSAKIGRPHVLDVTRDDQKATVRVRYHLIAHLPAAASAVIDAEKLSWIEHTDYDLRAATSFTRLLPDNYADRLTASAHSTFTTDPADETRTIRSTEGELKVRMHFVGGRVERIIVDDLRDHMVAEAQQIDRFLRP